MKSIGIVRSVDREGRIVIPIELRKIFNLQTGTPIEIYTEGDFIILHKYQNNCAFCGSNKIVSEFKNKALCKDCLDSIKNIHYLR